MFNRIVRWFTQPELSNFEFLVYMIVVMQISAMDTILEFVIAILIATSVSVVNKILFKMVSEENRNDV